MKPIRRHAFVLIGGITLFIIATGLVNSWVNPLRVTPAPWSDPAFDPYRDISSQIRTGKAGLIRSHPQIDVAFLGSSRVENGFDPELSFWEDQEVLNLGCSGGYVFETEGIADYLLERSKPSVIICGIDPGDLSRSTDSRDTSDYYASPFASGSGRIDRELRYLFGVSTLETSLETIKRRSSQQASPYTSKGLRGVENEMGQGSQIGFIRRQLIGNAFGRGESNPRTEIVPEKIEVLRRLMTQARHANTRLIVFIHPQHAIMLASSADVKAPPLFFPAERPALVALVEEVNKLPAAGPPIELWDFFDFHPLNCEKLPLGEKNARMAYWDDLGHFSVEVGNAMQARMMDWPVSLTEASNYGFKLSRANLQERETQIMKGYRAYLTGPGRTDVQWKEELIDQSSKR